MKSFVRCKPISNYRYLAKMEEHGRGRDQTSLRRVAHPDAPRALAATLQPDGNWAASWAVDEPGYDVKKAFATHKKRTGGKERKGAQLGLHLLLGVTPAWVCEAGDLHDPENPRNVELLNAAVHWAKSEQLDPYAARIDLNERGGGVVDVFCAPVRKMATGRAGKIVSWISTRRAKIELAERYGRTPAKSFSALQDGWAEWCQRELDPRLERGTPKEATQREHLTPEAYAAAQADLRRELEPAVKSEVRERAQHILADAEAQASRTAAAAAERLRAEAAEKRKRADAERAEIIRRADAERAEKLREAEAESEKIIQAAYAERLAKIQDAEDRERAVELREERSRRRELILKQQHEEVSGLYSKLQDQTRQSKAEIKEGHTALKARATKFEKMAREVVESLKKQAHKLRGHVRNKALRMIEDLAKIAGIHAGEMQWAPRRGSATPAASSTSGAGQANPQSRQRRPSGAEMGKK